MYPSIRLHPYPLPPTQPSKTKTLPSLRRTSPSLPPISHFPLPP